jgi:hypothetical protein
LNSLDALNADMAIDVDRNRRLEQGVLLNAPGWDRKSFRDYTVEIDCGPAGHDFA